MFNSIFGALGQAALTGQGIYQSNPQALQNAHGNPQLAQQQMMAAYNRAQQQRTARWMINGEVFNSAKDFALAMWPDDEQARLMFALKYPD